MEKPAMQFAARDEAVRLGAVLRPYLKDDLHGEAVVALYEALSKQKGEICLTR